jgi:hypothetical protein
VDATSLRQALERIDAALTGPADLWIRGGAALLALGYEGRVTSDIDVLPGSQFIEVDLRDACERAGLAWNPPDKDFPPGDYLEIVPASSLVLPAPAGDYDVVFRGRMLTVRTPPPADLVIGKLKRLDAEDLGDVHFLVAKHGVVRPAIEEAFARLPERLRLDPVLQDNLRYVLEDLRRNSP